MARGNLANLRRGRADQRPREGRLQRAARRLLIARNGSPVTTRELAEYAFPDSPLPHWRWYTVRMAAERYAERVTPRTRPLRWRAKPGAWN
jgi:hypothetical protein